MPRGNPAYPPAFTAEAVRLARSSDKSPSALARDLGVADQTLRIWGRQAEPDPGAREGLTQGGREEPRRPRREVRTLRQEREILKKTAACFASESDATR